MAETDYVRDDTEEYTTKLPEEEASYYKFLTEYDEEKVKAEFFRDGVSDGEHKNAVSSALRMIKAGKLTNEEIAEYQNLPLEEVIALSKQINF